MKTFAELAALAELGFEGRTLSDWGIDLAPLEILEVLAEARCRVVQGKAEIFFNGEWMAFGRTDLKDDVGTTLCGDTMDALLSRVARYLERGVYGARVRMLPHGTYFSVIDALSDG